MAPRPVMFGSHGWTCCPAAAAEFANGATVIISSGLPCHSQTTASSMRKTPGMIVPSTKSHCDQLP